MLSSVFGVSWEKNGSEYWAVNSEQLGSELTVDS